MKTKILNILLCCLSTILLLSCSSRSTKVGDNQITFDANSKYLLLPIEDTGDELSVQLLVDDKQQGESMNIRIAQNKTDYWVPIDISQYKGLKVTLAINSDKKVNMNSIGIKQSDSFEFDYNEKYRPSYHFTPQYGWMNDPNGMVYHNGEYHLFYQYNPYGSRWANMHWGHAVSKDLTTWEHLLVGIVPDSLGAVFSGSAIIDKNNTAGFGADAMIAIYTSAGKTQTQSIAYSLDNGRTFTKYDGNPVLTDPNIADFRDPKVFWHEPTNKWIMSLATSQTITFYGSSDLKKWDKLSEFGQGIGNHDGVWECPDLVPLTHDGKPKWVLIVSINPGGPNGGSASQYFIGDFDGTSFKADALPYPLWLDYGRDNYAGVTWSNVPEQDGRKIFIGWMNNWNYANNLPITNFRGAMTLPRELAIAHNGKHLVVVNPPVKEVLALRKESSTISNIEVSSTYTIDKLLANNNGCYELEMTIKTSGSSDFYFKLTNQKGEELIYKFNDGTLSVDRTKSGLTDFDGKFPSVSKGPLGAHDLYKVRLFIDKSSSELFLNDGKHVVTNAIFPTEPFNSLTFGTDKGKLTVTDISVHNL